MRRGRVGHFAEFIGSVDGVSQEAGAVFEKLLIPAARDPTGNRNLCPRDTCWCEMKLGRWDDQGNENMQNGSAWWFLMSGGEQRMDQGVDVYRPSNVRTIAAVLTVLLIDYVDSFN